MVEFRDTGYLVTEEGVVFGKRGKPLVPSKTCGYDSVKVCKDGTITYFRIHRMVAECYLPNPENHPCVNHKDGDKFNNHKDNLEWCTYKENSTHAVETGLAPSGEGLYDSTLSSTEVIFICERLSLGKSIQEVFYESLEAGFIPYPNRIADIKRRKTWKGISKDYNW